MRTPILSPAGMAAAEQSVFDAGTDSFAVMRRAGEGVASALHARYPKGDIAVLCGPGGNGGDGFVAAAWLAERGRTVRVHALVPPDRLSGDPAKAAALWSGAVIPLEAAIDRPAAVMLDALFGGGLSRPLSGAAATLSTQTAGTVVAVDVPSGIDGAAARALGPAFRADLTVTFAALRHAHAFAPARATAGSVLVLDIGVPVTTQLWQVPATAFRRHLERQPVRRIGMSDLASQWPSSSESAAALVDTLRQMSWADDRAILFEGDDTVLVEPSGDAIVLVGETAALQPYQGQHGE